MTSSASLIRSIRSSTASSIVGLTATPSSLVRTPSTCEARDQKWVRLGRRVDLAVEVPRGLAVLAAGLDTVTVRSGEEIAASAGVRVTALCDIKPENLFLTGLSLGFLFAVILGVGAGLYPSLRASRMEVVSAIRYE